MFEVGYGLSPETTLNDLKLRDAKLYIPHKHLSRIKRNNGNSPVIIEYQIKMPDILCNMYQHAQLSLFLQCWCNIISFNNKLYPTLCSLCIIDDLVTVIIIVIITKETAVYTNQKMTLLLNGWPRTIAEAMATATKFIRVS